MFSRSLIFYYVSVRGVFVFFIILYLIWGRWESSRFFLRVVVVFVFIGCLVLEKELCFGV